MNRESIILIGMPGSGKSTVGVILAKQLRKDFLDTDILIQRHTGRSLQSIVNREGHMSLRRIEEEVLLSVHGQNLVIATGGSAAYSEPAMRHLQRQGVVVFLQTELEELKARIHNYETRGLAKRPDQDLQDLFIERESLYQRYAEITIDGSQQTQDQVADEIIHQLDKYSQSAKMVCT
ncbi:MAG: shikimate kinase [Deltaproteobacteria bacterium]|nr:MAG: shikimate kinase [Deltaproteobacteria bacterium]PIE73199.1 MAG: shikimate kinase [Deltaproteobacteria bacterium]